MDSRTVTPVKKFTSGNIQCVVSKVSGHFVPVFMYTVEVAAVDRIKGEITYRTNFGYHEIGRVIALLEKASEWMHLAPHR